VQCVASGCSGSGSVYNACTAPFDVSAAMSLVVFVCSEGPTVDLPTQCGGGSKHVALFRFGNSNFKVTASGTNPIIVNGDCNAVTGCSGASSTTSRQVNKLTMAMVGTTSKTTLCVQLAVDIEVL